MSRRKRRGQDALGVVLIALAFVLLAGGVSAAFLLRPPPIDPETLCRTDAPLPAHTIILVDATDKLEPRHKKRLRAVVASERARLPRYGRLTVLKLRPDKPREPKIVFTLCNPGEGRLFNPLTSNVGAAQARWEQAFAAPLEAAVRRAGAGKAAQSSPIAEALAAAVADPDFSPAIPHRRLALVSDLLENGEAFSVYGRDVGEAYRRYQAAHAGENPPSLAGVSVRVAPLDRPGREAEQSRARTEFWAPFFAAADAADISYDPTP